MLTNEILIKAELLSKLNENPIRNGKQIHLESSKLKELCQKRIFYHEHKMNIEEFQELNRLIYRSNVYIDEYKSYVIRRRITIIGITIFIAICFAIFN